MPRQRRSQGGPGGHRSRGGTGGYGSSLVSVLVRGYSLAVSARSGMERIGRGELGGDDLTALGQLTSIWRQLVAVVQRNSPEELLGSLERLGVDRDEGRRVLTIFDQLHHVTVPEPGQVLGVNDGCGLGWQPSVLAPVFYGNKEIDGGGGLARRCGFASHFPVPTGRPALRSR
jgi:hypothetical protein